MLNCMLTLSPFNAKTETMGKKTWIIMRKKASYLISIGSTKSRQNNILRTMLSYVCSTKSLWITQSAFSQRNKLFLISIQEHSKKARNG